MSFEVTNILNIKVKIIEEHFQLKISLKIRPYIKGFRKNHKKSDPWKIQLAITIRFISCTDNDNDDEERVMHLKLDDREIRINDKGEEVSEEFFESLHNRCQNNLEKSMNGGGFVLDYVYLLQYKCNKIHLNCGRSYIDSTDWIKSKKATANSINKKDKCLHYAVTIALNHE